MSYAMSKAIFSGPKVDLIAMLDAREARVAMQKQLLEAEPANALLSATMNIPGEVKTSPAIRDVMKSVTAAVVAALADTKAASAPVPVSRNLPTGPEYYLSVPIAATDLKKRMIQIEQDHPWGRLVDLDVLWLENGLLKSISREALNLPVRTCFICDQPAKECGRSRRHTVSEMQTAIAQLIEKGREHEHE